MTAAAVDFEKIQLLVLDVDGVLTDGRIVLTDSGEEMKFFHVHDGAGIKYWRRVGKKVALISGRSSQAVMHRAEELSVDFVRMGCKDKLPAYLEAVSEMGVTDAQTAVVGDDLTDLPAMWRCAFPVAVANAVAEAREAATYVTKALGGHGAAREVIELILKQTGQWDEIMHRYRSAGASG